MDAALMRNRKWIAAGLFFALVALPLFASSRGGLASADEPSREPPSTSTGSARLWRYRELIAELKELRRKESRRKETRKRAALRSSMGLSGVIGDDVLAELGGVGLVIEVVNENAIEIGVTEAAIRRAVRSTLRLRQLPVLSTTRRLSAPGLPYLYVNVNVIGNAFGVSVELKEHVLLERHTVRTQAVTWDTSATGIHAGDGYPVLRSTIKLVERFALAWQEENLAK